MHCHDMTLNNGVKMPRVGFGVFKVAPADTVAAVASALEAGYRLVDTASAYGNEREVGEAIAAGGLKREEIFVTTKLWVTQYGYDPARRGIAAGLAKLGLEYADMVLLHFPVPSAFEDTIAAYRALEQELKDGRIRAIGVCNFHARHLERLIAESDIVPAVNQVELHPLFNQEALIRTHRRLGIATQAWSPLGAVLIYDAASPEKARHVLADPVITELAARYGKSPAQIILRWHVQRDVAVIPKSVHPERMRENIAIFDFSLAEEDGNSASGCRNPGRARPGACRKKYLSCGSRPIGAA